MAIVHTAPFFSLFSTHIFGLFVNGLPLARALPCGRLSTGFDPSLFAICPLIGSWHPRD